MVLAQVSTLEPVLLVMPAVGKELMLIIADPVILFPHDVFAFVANTV